MLLNKIFTNSYISVAERDGSLACDMQSHCVHSRKTWNWVGSRMLTQKSSNARRRRDCRKNGRRKRKLEAFRSATGENDVTSRGFPTNVLNPAMRVDLSPQLGGDTQWPINPPTTVLLSFTFILPPPPERCKVSQQVWNRVMNWTWTCVSPYCDLLD